MKHGEKQYLRGNSRRARRFAEANWPGQHFPVYNDPAGVIIREMITGK